MDGHNDYFGRALRLMQVGFWIETYLWDHP